MSARRTHADLSQSDLATRMGVSRQSINSLETGRYLPSLNLARFFGTAVVLFATFAAAAVAVFLWSGRSDADLAALLGGVGARASAADRHPRHRRRRPVMALLCLVLAPRRPERH